MHSLYFTRHGETVWNVENKICGMTGTYLRTVGTAGEALLTVSAPQTQPVALRFTIEKEDAVWN